MVYPDPVAGGKHGRRLPDADSLQIHSNLQQVVPSGL